MITRVPGLLYGGGERAGGRSRTDGLLVSEPQSLAWLLGEKGNLESLKNAESVALKRRPPEV